MRSSETVLLGMPFRVGVVLAIWALRGASGCGTQPCFRHSDCASTEVCSAGECVIAPVEFPVLDAGWDAAGGSSGAGGSGGAAGAAVTDSSMPPPIEAGSSDATTSELGPEGGDAAPDAPHARDAAGG